MTEEGNWHPPSSIMRPVLYGLTDPNDGRLIPPDYAGDTWVLQAALDQLVERRRVDIDAYYDTLAELMTQTSDRSVWGSEISRIVKSTNLQRLEALVKVLGLWQQKPVEHVYKFSVVVTRTSHRLTTVEVQVRAAREQEATRLAIEKAEEMAGDIDFNEVKECYSETTATDYALKSREPAE